MNSYEKACLFVKIYEKHLEHLFKPTGVEEIDSVRKYLIHDIRLVNAIMSGYSQVENADAEANYPLSELVKIHQEWRSSFDKMVLAENGFLSDQYSKNQGVFTKTANFYLKGAYIKYGIDEENALDIVSKITGLAKEKLKEAKAKKMNPTELEKHLENEIDFERKSYNFKTNTIYSEMKSLLEKANYESLDIEGKINAIEDALKIYLTRIIHCIPGGSDFFRDFEKTVEDLIELMASYSNNPDNVWDIINYLVWIIGTLGKPFNIVSCDDSNLKGEPFIDTDRMLIYVHVNISPVIVFKTIYERLFNIQYLEKGISLNMGSYPIKK